MLTLSFTSISRMSIALLDSVLLTDGATHDPVSPLRILSNQRKPLGYIDVASLKKKWEAGEANPVGACSLLHSRASDLLADRQCPGLCN